MELSFGDMSVTKGQKHNFVGMNIELKNDGEVLIEMDDYIKECIQTFGESFNGGAKTPATTDLFENESKVEELNEEKKEIFII